MMKPCDASTTHGSMATEFMHTLLKQNVRYSKCINYNVLKTRRMGTCCTHSMIMTRTRMLLLLRRVVDAWVGMCRCVKHFDSEYIQKCS